MCVKRQPKNKVTDTLVNVLSLIMLYSYEEKTIHNICTSRAVNSQPGGGKMNTCHI